MPNPESAPIQAFDGNFYGTTDFGGIHDGGTSGIVYQLSRAGAVTTIYDLDSSIGSRGDYSPLQGPDGNLYIATLYGGAGNCGGILKLSTAGVLENAVSLDCGPGGGNPSGPLILASDGNFYGAAFNGGTFSDGVVFKLTRNLTYTVLYNFGTVRSEGNNPSGAVIQATDHKLYGLDLDGSNFGLGTIYDSTLGGTVSTVYDWTAFSSPEGQLTQHTNGTLYGATPYGGPQNLGTVFTLNQSLDHFIALVRYAGKTGSAVQILGQALAGTTERNVQWRSGNDVPR